MMKKRVAGTMVGLTLGLVAVLPGFGAASGVGLTTARLQPSPSPVVASPEVSPTPLPARTTGADLTGEQALANVVDTLIVNGPLLTHLVERGGEQRVVSRAEVSQARVVNLRNVLSSDELTSLVRLVNNSRELRRAVTTVQRLVRNDPQFQSVLQGQNVNANQIVALDLTAEPIVYVISTTTGARPSPQPSPGVTTGSPTPTTGGATAGSPTPTTGGATAGSPTPTTGGATAGTPTPTTGVTTGTPTPTTGGATAGTPTPTPGAPGITPGSPTPTRPQG